MIKLQDFARECGVTDRAIQKHLKTYASELEGLYQRKGPNGTWLTEEACEILRSKMRQQPIIVGDSSTHDELEATKKELAALQARHAALADRLSALAEWKAEKAMEIAAAEQRQLLLEEAQRDKKLLEGFVADAKAEIAVLTDEKGQAEEKARAAEKTAQAASEETQRAKAEKAAWAKYAADLEAWAALSWWRRKGKKKPEAPAMEDDYGSV